MRSKRSRCGRERCGAGSRADVGGSRRFSAVAERGQRTARCLGRSAHKFRRERLRIYHVAKESVRQKHLLGLRCGRRGGSEHSARRHRPVRHQGESRSRRICRGVRALQPRRAARPAFAHDQRSVQRELEQRRFLSQRVCGDVAGLLPGRAKDVLLLHGRDHQELRLRVRIFRPELFPRPQYARSDQTRRVATENRPTMRLSSWGGTTISAEAGFIQANRAETALGS